MKGVSYSAAFVHLRLKYCIRPERYLVEGYWQIGEKTERVTGRLKGSAEMLRGF